MSLFDKVSKVFDLVAKNEANVAKALNYLTKFGYLNDKQENTIENVLSAISRLHTIAGLLPTDIITGKTLSIMDLPRCSMMDNQVESATALNKWGQNKLTYCINSRDTDMSIQEWDGCFKQAFDYWSEVCNLTFTQVESPSQANLLINVGRGRQDDFDGSSGTLAWFQLPPNSNYKGQLQGKFDADELWGKTHGIRLTHVACHEIGHGLGLTHSNISSALMAPFYSVNVAKPQNNDDIPRAVARYGKPVIIGGNPPTNPPIPTAPTIPPVSPVPTNEIIIKVTGSISKIDIPGYRIQKLS